jgi:integral membrane protein
MGIDTSASFATALGRFRIVAFWEGWSYLVLLFIAMPLKYGLGMPQAVRIVGMAHGLLFIAYLVTLALAARTLGLRGVVVALVASIVPGGTFWQESRLRRDDARARGARAAA